MNASHLMKRTALALAVAAIAVPVAQAGLGGSTEAKGYLRISEYLVHHGAIGSGGGLTKAEIAGGLAPGVSLGNPELARLAAISEAKDLGGQTEAKGYAAISRSLVENGTPGPVAVSSPGFAWSDAGVGAGITVAAAMLALLGTTGVVSTRRRRTSVA